MTLICPPVGGRTRPSSGNWGGTFGTHSVQGSGVTILERHTGWCGPALVILEAEEVGGEGEESAGVSMGFTGLRRDQK